MTDLAASVLATARAMNAAGINRGAAGNVSARVEAGFIITPTGMTYDECTPADMVKVGIHQAPQKVGADKTTALQGGRAKNALMKPLRSRAVEHSTLSSPLRILAVADDRTAQPDCANMGTATGTRKPSSEWRFHHDIYAARPEAGAIVHAHSPFATALACQEIEIPPFHYMIARFGGATVRCADYATFGTQALSDAILLGLQQRCACLLAHHGMVVFGADLKAALALAIEFESLCEQYWRVLQLGQPKLLTADEMTRVIEKFKDYGQQ